MSAAPHPSRQLLRSCIVVGPEDPRQADLLLGNLTALAGAEIDWEVAADARLLAAIQTFVADHGHAPTAFGLTAALDGQTELIDRLEVVLLERRALVRGDFRELLHTVASQVHSTQLASVIRAAQPSWQRGDSVAAANQIAAGLVALADPTTVVSWPEPLPLDVTPALPACPIDVLPPVIRDLCLAVAASTGTDPAMAVAFSLGALAAVAQRGYSWLVAGDWREAAALFVAAIALPAERKSAVMRAVMSVVYDWEQEREQENADKAREHAARLGAKKAEAKESKSDRRVELAMEVAELEAATPIAPVVATGDATQEALFLECARQGGSISLISTEGGGPFSVAGGRYSETASFERWLQGFDADVMRELRISREGTSIREPNVSISVACQPSVLRQLAAIPGARSMGLMARFLFVFPRSSRGTVVETTPVPPAVHVAWARVVRGILDASLGLSARRRVPLDPAARRLHREFEVELEPRLVGDLAPLRDWAGKHAGIVARIAGLFALVSSVDRGERMLEEVDVDSMRRALELSPWLVAHAQAALSASATDPTTSAAQDLLDWARTSSTRSVTRRELRRKLHGRSWLVKAADLDAPLHRLADLGWLRLATTGKTQVVTFSPRLFEPAPQPVIEPPANTPPIKTYDYVLTYDDVAD